MIDEMHVNVSMGRGAENTLNILSGRDHRHYHYRWLNDVSLTAEKDSPVVCWVELQILDDKGKIAYRNCRVTSHHISEQTLVGGSDAVHAAGAASARP
ncbi:MAG: hypothetical protein ABSG17_08170 [Spirochaetia bacterium]